MRIPRLRPSLALLILLFALLPALAAPVAEELTLFHVGDQESWLISAQGNRYDTPDDPISFYGGAARLSALLQQQRTAALAAGRAVLVLNAGDSFLPGPRLTASLKHLAQAAPGGGQDFYDAIVLRRLGFTAVCFGNHEFDLGPDVTAQFVAVAGTPYLSANLDFSGHAALQALVAEGRIAKTLIVDTPKGNRIAVIGATTPRLPDISSPGAVTVRDRDPAADEDTKLLALAPLLQAEIDRARSAGASVVVLLSHLQGYRNELKLVPKLSGLDVFVSGGGHELMTSPGMATILDEPAMIRGYPQVVALEDGSRVLGVTGNFGNRYIGELQLSLDAQGRVRRDADGVPLTGTGSRMHRVSGNPADADHVLPDPVIEAGVVQPVRAFIAALSEQKIATTPVELNGVRGSAAESGAQAQYGVRNSETNLGNLVADAGRFAAGTDLAIQNGGGIRTSIRAGEVSAGDVFNVLPFTNLIVQFRGLDAGQLRILMEHALANASPDGAASGRFAQVSGLRIVYDSRRPPLQLDADGRPAGGGRILSMTLDDGTQLVEDGIVRTGVRPLSLATIDFTARGGDGYPFARLGLTPEPLVHTIHYQEALLDYLSQPADKGGLGGVIDTRRYGPVDPQAGGGRLIDRALLKPVSGLPGRVSVGRREAAV